MSMMLNSRSFKSTLMVATLFLGCFSFGHEVIAHDKITVQQWGVVGQETTYTTVATWDSTTGTFKYERKPTGTRDLYGFYTVEQAVGPHNHGFWSSPGFWAATAAVVGAVLTYVATDN